MNFYKQLYFYILYFVLANYSILSAVEQEVTRCGAFHMASDSNLLTQWFYLSSFYKSKNTLEGILY